ncbi:NAD(P)H-dependent oxidoreductase [Streptomyces sp. NBC_01352]|uniref:FMN-dependent NADH-azoreductase n=1 Tax=Streptomyces sp. NBC_01352 TaxID=2903834 RepID=UPI002E331393|nr:NAD(P)H-dependent oxidoreductase [Streptomyces sp. NBC_01352]
MATLLHIDSSAFPAEASTSRTVTDVFRKAWEAQHPTGAVIYRDLAAHPVPHITADAYLAAMTDPATHTPGQAAAFAARLKLVEELESADAVLIGVPMYNFSIPSSLKAWLDHVIYLGRTVRADNSKIKGTPVTVVSSRGGSYAPGTPMAPNEHVLNYLESVLTGLLEVEPHFIVADLTMAANMPGMEHLIPVGEKSRAQALEDATARAKELADSLAA